MRYQVISESEAKEMFVEFFDETVGEVEIGRLTYSASYALRMVDEVAYDEEFSNYVDNLVDEGILVEGYTDDQLEEELEEDEVDGSFVPGQHRGARFAEEM